jgi:predicted nucleic acid-binding protein
VGAVLLDTTVLIDLLRGRPGATQQLGALRARGDTAYTCAITVEEVTRGLRGQREVEAAGRLFDGLRVTPLTREHGSRAGNWRRTYAQRGRTLTQSDCLIAAAAALIDATLATGNPRDFPMSELHVEHWPVGA